MNIEKASEIIKLKTDLFIECCLCEEINKDLNFKLFTFHDNNNDLVFIYLFYYRGNNYETKSLVLDVNDYIKTASKINSLMLV